MRSYREPPEAIPVPPRGNSLLTRQHNNGATLLTLLWGFVLFLILYLWARPC
jgi:hypothetical protein